MPALTADSVTTVTVETPRDTASSVATKCDGATKSLRSAADTLEKNAADWRKRPCSFMSYGTLPLFPKTRTKRIENTLSEAFNQLGDTLQDAKIYPRIPVQQIV